MTVDEFIHELESLYGDYEPAMSERIKFEYSKHSLSALDKLCATVTSTYKSRGKYTGPPSLGVINGIIDDKAVSLALKDTQQYCSVCEFCGCRFHLDRFACPACNKRRRFGAVAKGDPETPSEIQARIRARSQGAF